MRRSGSTATISRSEGLFASVALHGTVVPPDNEINEALCGMPARDVLTGEKKMTVAQLPPVVRIFPQTLARNIVQ
jgi:lipid-binding SYLF domain-containing protein